MSDIQRAAERVMRQHFGAIEKALREILSTGTRMEDLSRVANPSLDGRTLGRDAIRHEPTGSFLFAVETTMGDTGFHTRGWAPEGGKYPWGSTIESALATAKAVGDSTRAMLDAYSDPTAK